MSAIKVCYMYTKTRQFQGGNTKHFQRSEVHAHQGCNTMHGQQHFITRSTIHCAVHNWELSTLHLIHTAHRFRCNIHHINIHVYTAEFLQCIKVLHCNGTGNAQQQYWEAIDFGGPQI